MLRELRTEGKAGEAERRELLCVLMVGEPGVPLKGLSGYQLGNQESGFPSKGSEERLEGFQPGVSGPVCILESSLWSVPFERKWGSQECHRGAGLPVERQAVVVR